MRNTIFSTKDQKPRCDRWLCDWGIRMVAAGAFFGVLLGAMGCSDEGVERVVLFGASSMSEALRELEVSFEKSNPGIDLECVFAGSQTLAMQINEGAPADVFVSADLSQMERTNGFGEPKVLVENRLVAIGSLESTGTTITEMISQAERVIVAQVDVPVGQYTILALEELGAWDAVKVKVVSQEHSVRGVLGKIALGQADLGFVYRTDALSEIESVRVIEFPPESSTITQTWIARRDESVEKNLSVSVVYRFLTESLESQRIFMEHGFLVVEGTP